jgi:hypothetical protein
MIFIVQTTGAKQSIKAYCLSCIASSEYTIIPVSDSTILDLTQTCLEHLRIQFTTISLKEFRALNLVSLRAHEQLIYDAIDDSTTLYDIAQQLLFCVELDSGQSLNNLEDLPCVVSRSPQVSEQALMYSLLNRRPLIILSNNDALLFQVCHRVKSLFISLDEHFNTTDLVALFAAKVNFENTVPCGFMYPYGDTEREWFVIKNTIYSNLPYPHQRELSLHYPLEPSSMQYSDERVSFFMGNTDSAHEINQDLLQPKELLITLSHSNGVDMPLGKTVLCPRLTQYCEKHNPLIKAMPCFYKGGECSRTSPGVESFQVNDIKARVAFFYTCWGILFKGGLFDPDVSFARQLVLSPYVGSIISSYSLSHMDKSVISNFIEHYYQNCSLGSIVDKLNAFHFQRYHDNEYTMIILGDPEFKSRKKRVKPIESLFPPDIALFVANEDQYKRQSNIINTPAYSVYQEQISSFLLDISFTKFVVLGSQSLPHPEMRSLAQVFGRQLDVVVSRMSVQFKRSIEHRLSPFDINQAQSYFRAYLKRYQRAWVQYFLVLNKHYGGLVRLQMDRYYKIINTENETSKRCPYCRGSLIVNHLSHVTNPAVQRRIYECYNCTTVQDGSYDFSISSICCNSIVSLSKGSLISLDLTKDVDCEGESLYIACLCIEPFYKKKNIEPHSICQNGSLTLNKGENHIVIEMELPIVPSHFSVGTYFLNAIIIVASSVVLLRRQIVIADTPSFRCEAGEGVGLATENVMEKG